MWPNPQEIGNLVIFTEEILNEKLPFFVQWMLLLVVFITAKRETVLCIISQVLFKD